MTLALTYFTRMRFITNLLPLLWAATTLKRVVVVFAGTKEGPIFADDYQCNNVSILKIASIRGHMCSMIDFGMESIAKNAPEVGFVHDYPGFVKTNIFEKTPGVWIGFSHGHSPNTEVVSPFCDDPGHSVRARSSTKDENVPRHQRQPHLLS